MEPQHSYAMLEWLFYLHLNSFENLVDIFFSVEGPVKTWRIKDFSWLF